MSWVGRLACSGMVLAVFLVQVPLLRAQETFDYNYIISDFDLTDFVSMDAAAIQSFFELYASPLATYVDPVTALRANVIVAIAAKDFQVSPKFLLTLMQKEQSLIEDVSPSPTQFDWATGYAVCDGCNVSDPALQKFKGFYNQLYNAAKRIRTAYLIDLAVSGQTSSGFGPGISKLVDGVMVVPANAATAVLYTYTPHLKGNRLFGTLWTRYFSRIYPDGTLLRVEGEPEIWKIELGERRRFTSMAVYLSFYSDLERVITVNRTELKKYIEGNPIGLPNYSYVRVPRGTVYLIVDNTTRGFASREALRLIGVNPTEILQVTEQDIAGYEVGEAITVKSVYPLGALMQDSKTGGVYFVKDGVKHAIISKEILRAAFPGRKIMRRSTKELAIYPTSDPVLFPEGELLRAQGDSVVYLISNQARRPFASLEVFRLLGFVEGKVRTVPQVALDLHQLGQPITAIINAVE